MLRLVLAFYCDDLYRVCVMYPWDILHCTCITHTHVRTHAHTHTHTHTQVNGRILYEGVLKIYWGLKKAITLAPGVMYAKSRNTRDSIYDFIGVDDAAYVMMLEEAQKVHIMLLIVKYM